MACEEKEQKMTWDEIDIRRNISNINSAYRLGLIKMSDVIRLIKTLIKTKALHGDKEPYV